MTTLSYPVPTAGSTLNSIADPEIVTALTSILAWANGSVDTGNLSAAAGILGSQLAANSGKLKVTVQATGYTAQPGDLVEVGSGGTYTIPTPVGNTDARIGFWANFSGGAAATINAALAGSLYMVGNYAGSSFQLGAPGSFAVFQSDGSAWISVAGQQDSGWQALSLINGWSAAGGTYTPAIRVAGDVIRLRGGLNGSSATTQQFTTAPTGMRPATTVAGTAYSNSLGAVAIAALANGSISLPTGATLLQIDCVSYPLV